MSGGHDRFAQTWDGGHPPASNGARRNLSGSPPNTFPQYGASSQVPPPTSPFNTAPGPQGQFEPFERQRGPQSPVVDQSHSRRDDRPPPPEHPQWAHGNNNGNGGLPQGHPRGFVDISSSAKLPQPQRTSHPYNPPAPLPNDAPEFSTPTNQFCRIPECRNQAFYDYAEQEQTEYCGQGHELHAISTGLVNRCAMCKGRPRRTGERVCGRTCRERERQAHIVQGSYYGVPVVRHEPRTGPGGL